MTTTTRSAPPSSSSSASSVRVFPNSLPFTEHPKCLLYSAWLSKPQDADLYTNCQFQQAPALMLTSTLPPIPVATDGATLRFVAGCRVWYTYVQYRDDETQQWRVRITAMNVDTTTVDETLGAGYVRHTPLGDFVAGFARPKPRLRAPRRRTNDLSSASTPNAKPS
jgi:hypothetical protein